MTKLLNPTIKVLLIEDNPGDVRLIEEFLKESPLFQFKCETVNRLEKGIEILEKEPLDIVLLDLSLPDSEGLQTFMKMRQHAEMVPVVVMSGIDNELLALEAVRNGAQDYLVKGKVDGSMLSRVLRYAIERKAVEESLRKTAEDLARSNRDLGHFSRQLRAANERLKKLDEMKSSFISAASHELRTPLTSIKGYVAIVLQGRAGSLNDQQKEFLGYVKDSTDRLHRLLDDLLDLSRIESGRVEMKMVQTDIAELLREEIMIFKIQADQKAIRLEAEIEPELKKVFCDPDKIREVIDNLISNAVKYTPPNGQVRVIAKNNSNSVEMEVQDTGIGISLEDQERIFEPFQRIHRSAVEEEEGSGLGLALVKRIVEAQGGNVSVRSQEQQGSSFIVMLPVEKRMELRKSA